MEVYLSEKCCARYEKLLVYNFIVYLLSEMLVALLLMKVSNAFQYWNVSSESLDHGLNCEVHSITLPLSFTWNSSSRDAYQVSLVSSRWEAR